MKLKLGNTPPVDFTGQPIEDFNAQLAYRRQVEDAGRADELERLRAVAEHDRARADVAESTRLAELDRGERGESADAAARLARMYRQARDAGERVRISAHMARSGEARALRLERLRVLNLRVLVPVMLGFAAWSTTGVHDGAARLMAVPGGSAVWWALWLLEPVLIGAVAWVIVARARLASAGGRLAVQAQHIAGACLATSIGLNLIAGAHVAHQGNAVALAAAVFGSMVAHAIGPVFAAATAHLIGVIDTSISDADPWHERLSSGHTRPVPLLADMKLTLGPALGTAPAGAPAEPSRPAGGDASRTADSDTSPAAASVPAEVESLAADRAEQQGSAAPAHRTGRRPNKGVRVPASARKTTPSPRALTDAQLRDRLTALQTAGDLPAAPSLRQVQGALGIGHDRAKRLLTTPTPNPDQATPAAEAPATGRPLSVVRTPDPAESAPAREGAL